MWLNVWSMRFAWFREHGVRGMGRPGAIAAMLVVVPVIAAALAITITTSQEPERGPGFALGVDSYFGGSAHLEMTWGQHRRVACDYALTMHQRYADPVEGFDAEEFVSGCVGPPPLKPQGLQRRARARQARLESRDRDDRDGDHRWVYRWNVSRVDRADPVPMDRAEADGRFAAAIAADAAAGQDRSMLIESALDACHQHVNGVPRAQIGRDVAARLELSEGAAGEVVDAALTVYCPPVEE